MRSRRLKFLPPQVAEHLVRYAELRGISPEAVIVTATEQYLQDTGPAFAAHAQRCAEQARSTAATFAKAAQSAVPPIPGAGAEIGGALLDDGDRYDTDRP